MTPLVSIIIPNYNCAPYLRQAVESALAQTYPMIEVVVIDDGSTDASATTIADLVGDGRVLLQSQANAGVAAARNAGIAASQGQYLVFLDCDDYLHPGMVARLMEQIDLTDHRVFAYADFVRVDVAGVPLPESKPLKMYRTRLEGNLLAPLLIGCYILPLSILMSRQLILEVGGFSPAYTGGDDYEIWLRVSCGGGIARYVNESLAYYRHRPDSQGSDIARQRNIERRILRDFIANNSDQILRVMPEFLEEVRDSAELAWRGSQKYLDEVEQYAHSLESALAQRNSSLREAQAYASILQDELTKYERSPALLPDPDALIAELPASLTVSIMIAFANCSPYLRQTVESALNQTYHSLEVVIIDDGSTDGSLDLITDLLGDHRVQAITQPSQGLAAARNKGIDASHGHYLVFLDGGDYLEADMVERMVGLIEPTNQWMFAYCDYVKIDDSGVPIPDQRTISSVQGIQQGDLLPSLLASNFIPTNCVLISRALTIGIGSFDTHYRSCEAYDLWLRVACCGGQARYLDAKLGYYRIQPLSFRSDPAHMAAAAESIRRTICARYPTQVAHATPSALAEVWRHTAVTWQEGLQHLRSAETYARSLEDTLAQRDAAFKSAETYAHSLEAELQHRNTVVATLEAQLRSLATSISATAPEQATL